jgi:hypothetical protein
MLTLTENQTNIKHSELETYLRFPPLLSSFHLFYLLSQILHAYYFSLNQNFQPKQRVGKGTLLFAHTSGLVRYFSLLPHISTGFAEKSPRQVEDKT